MSRRLTRGCVPGWPGTTDSGLSLAPILLLALPWAAPAQQFTADTLIPPVAYAVQGAPFVALVEETRTPVQSGQPQVHRLVRVLRDLDGRQRYEDLANPACPGCASPRAVAIYDVVAHRSIRLDPVAMTAAIQSMDPTAGPVLVPASGRFVQLPDAQQNGDAAPADSATQPIAGLEATLTRTSRQVQTRQGTGARSALVVDELWTSSLYRMPLMHVIDDPRSGRTVLRVIRFEAREPDPSLFAIPPGYAVCAEGDGAPVAIAPRCPAGMR
jgi:hypothetical protein